MGKAGPRGIGSVEVGGRLLKVLAQSPRPMMLRDLAQLANLTPAQAHGYLTSFRRVDLVEQEPESGRYSLGTATLRLGLGRLRSNSLLARATTAASSLCSVTGMMVALIVWGPAAPTVVHVVEGKINLGINIRHGSMFSVCGSSVGTVFAAFEDGQTIAGRIAAEKQGASSCGLDPSTIKGPSPSTLALAIERRYWGMRDDPVLGLTSVASPVTGVSRGLELVVALLSSNDELSLDEKHPALRALLDLTSQLSLEFP